MLAKESLIPQEKFKDMSSAYERNWKKIEGIDTDSFMGLVEINQITTDIFFQEEAFSDYWTVLGDDSDSREAVMRAVKIHNFPEQNEVDQIDALNKLNNPDKVEQGTYEKLLEASHIKEQLARSYILKHITEGTTFGLKDWELDVLGTSCIVAGDFDVMGYEWRKEVQKNPLNEKADELGLTNQYAVIREGNDGPVEIPFSDAFLPSVLSINDKFSELANRIDGKGEEATNVANYFKAYSRALGSTDLEELPELWRDVDRAWLKVKGRVQPIASREYDYYDPNGIRIFPDFRLGIANTESTLAKSVEATRVAMQKHLESEFGGIGIFEETKNGMSQVQVLPEVYDVVFAASLDFQPSGQFLPNEFEVKKEHGVKVFLNLESSRNRQLLALELVDKAFPHHRDKFDQVDLERDTVPGFLGGHEIGEPLFDTDWVRGQLGSDVFKLLNEDSATIAYTAIMPHRVKEGEIGRDALERHALNLLMTYLRYIDFARGAPHLQPYYKGLGLQGLRRMATVGYLRLEGDTVVIDETKLDYLYEITMRDLKEHAEIADTGDRVRALKYTEPIEGAEDIPEIARLIKILKS